MSNVKEMELVRAMFASLRHDSFSSQGDENTTVLERGKWYNPYLMEFISVKGYSFDRSVNLWESRDKLVRKYSWAIPNNAALSTLQKYTPILEVGAGNGYWTSCLRENGVDVLAFDLDVGKNNKYVDAHQWSCVEEGAPSFARKHKDRTLFLCWPPYETDMAYDALTSYEGETVIYVGEGNGGCTANDAFHALLEEEWNLIETVKVPQWYGIHDRMMVYRRKS